MNDYWHRILVEHEGAAEAERRLREHGYEPSVGDSDHVYTTLDFMAPRHIDLAFLRPDILPPVQLFHGDH